MRFLKGKSAKLQNENYLDYSEYDIWTVARSPNVTDYNSKPIPEYRCEYYIGDNKAVKKFVKKAAGQGNYLIICGGLTIYFCGISSPSGKNSSEAEFRQ